MSAAAAKWHQFFMNAGIPRQIAAQYAKLFVEQRIYETILNDIDKATLIELGITTIGDQLAILRYIRERQKSGGENEKTETQSHRSTSTSTSTSAVERRPEKAAATAAQEPTKLTRKRPAPDGDDIYHIHMPAGVTPKTKVIMAKHSQLRSAVVVGGLLKRGCTGVRQSGREVQPVSSRKKVIIASPEVSSTTAAAAAAATNVYERLGVQGLKSDSLPQPKPAAAAVSISGSSTAGASYSNRANPDASGASMLRKAFEDLKEGPVFRVRIPGQKRPSTSASRIAHIGVVGRNRSLQQTRPNQGSRVNIASLSVRKKALDRGGASGGIQQRYSKIRQHNTAARKSVFERLSGM